MFASHTLLRTFDPMTRRTPRPASRRPAQETGSPRRSPPGYRSRRSARPSGRPGSEAPPCGRYGKGSPPPCPPSHRIPAATASHASGLRLEITTVAPCSAIRVAIADRCPSWNQSQQRFCRSDRTAMTSWFPPYVAAQAGCRTATGEYAGRPGNVNQGRAMQNKRTGVYSREQLTRLLHPAKHRGDRRLDPRRLVRRARAGQHDALRRPHPTR